MQKSQRGFTLIELLVVIAIIGILSSVVLASMRTSRARSRDATRIAQIKQLQTALELYYLENGRYPISASCGATIPGSSWCNSVQSLSAGRWIRHNGANALNGVISVDPIDPLQGTTANWGPLNGGTYYYFSNDGRWYMLVYGLELYPHAIEQTDGVRDCANTLFHYGSGINGILTVGGNC